MINYKKVEVKNEFEHVDVVCYKLTKHMVHTFLIAYMCASSAQSISNALYCYYRDDGINPECLFVSYKFM